MGYLRAGFEVVGVDIEPQPNYPFRFVQGNAMLVDEFLAIGAFDAIHASPPCKAYSTLRAVHPDEDYPDLLDNTRLALEEWGRPYVIENVPGSPTRHLVVLCGSMFGLGVNNRQLRRHRNFATGSP